jgi:hypothetical protein
MRPDFRIRTAAYGLERKARSIIASVSGGEWDLELVEEFLRNANQCLRLAQEAHTIEAQIHWLSMAQFWRNLAQQVEEEEAVSRGVPAVPENGKSNGNGNSDHEH